MLSYRGSTVSGAQGRPSPLRVGWPRGGPRACAVVTIPQCWLACVSELMKAKGGKDFDGSYDQMQVKAHEDAVALFDAYAKGGDDPELKKWAAKRYPTSRSILAWRRN